MSNSGDKRAIGVFDSGLGGLTVLKAISRLLPDERLIYFGDSGRTPYGTKSRETVVKYSFQNINFLLEYDVKMIVIACNTASACSLSAVRSHYPLPIVEVIEPGARAAAAATKNNKIGVIGTPATIQSGVYESALRRILPDCIFYGKACPLFVPLVEEGWWDNQICRSVIAEYLGPLKDSGVDTLVLGCTHYPLLQPAIQAEMGEGVTLVNSASVVAQEVRDVLTEKGLQAPAGAGDGKHPAPLYFTSDSAVKFAELGSIFMNEVMTKVEKIDIDAR